MKRFILGCLVLVIGLATGIAQADFIDLPVKWSQLPDMDLRTAGRIRAEHPEMWGGQIVADDFLCESPVAVAAVRWWGSYLNTTLEPTADRYLTFEIVFHDDDPLVLQGDGTYKNSRGYLYSSPDVTLDWYFNVTAQEHFVGIVEDPTNPGVGAYNLYEYNAYLPWPFEQVEGITYWIDIEYDEQANIGGTGDPGVSWAWNTSLDAWNDKAVYGPNHSGVNGWSEFVCHNMAFELMVPVPAAVILGILGLSVAGIKLRKYA